MMNEDEHELISAVLWGRIRICIQKNTRSLHGTGRNELWVRSDPRHHVPLQGLMTARDWKRMHMILSHCGERSRVERFKDGKRRTPTEAGRPSSLSLFSQGFVSS